MRVIVTGTTGMVGEGVLLECLSSLNISEVLSVSRKPTGMNHPKLKEYLVSDFLSLQAGDGQLKDYDACFFCAGVSSIGKNEAEYTRITYDITLHFAKALSPDSKLTFVYVSGKGTDRSEKGRAMWARVKGKTENDLMKLPFKQVLAFRPGLMKPGQKQKRVLKMYKYLMWLYPVLRTVFPGMVNTMHQVGQAMINAAKSAYEKNIVEVKDITILAEKSSKSNL